MANVFPADPLAFCSWAAPYISSRARLIGCGHADAQNSALLRNAVTCGVILTASGRAAQCDIAEDVTPAAVLATSHEEMRACGLSRQKVINSRQPWITNGAGSCYLTAMDPARLSS